MGARTPTSTFSHSLNLYSGELDPTVYDGHTIETALDGSIPESIYICGPIPPLIAELG